MRARWFDLASSLSRSRDGVDTALETAPDPLRWSIDDRRRLAAGECVFRYERRQGVDVGTAAVVARAPAERIWQHVLDVDAYASFLPYVTASRLDRTWHEDHHVVQEATFELTTKGLVTRYRVRNHFHPDEGTLTFAMLSERGGALRDALGNWSVRPWSGGGCLVVYRVYIAAARWVPRFARRLAAARGLPAVAALIARRAEAS